MNIQSRHAEYILAVVRNKTMRKAAQEMFVTEATISQQIRQFERTLGVALFEHTGRGLYPTNECWQLMPDFERFVAARDAIEKHANLLSIGELKPATFVPTGGHLLCPYCHTPVTASNGTVTQMAPKQWDAMSHEGWQCGRCGQKFALPSNPFKATESEVLR